MFHLRAKARASVTRPLRFLSYLAPSVPEAFFEAVAASVGRALGVTTTVDFETKRSGPVPGEPDPLATSAADVAFVCAPTYAWLAATRSPPTLLAAPVPTDPRAGGRPVYFADVVVRRDEPARTFDELVGRRWAYNDVASLSGWFCLQRALAARPSAGRTIGAAIASGSHLASLALVAGGHADAAPIDSNVLGPLLRDDAPCVRALRIAWSWGPFPIQPVLARRTLPRSTQGAVRRALSAIPARALEAWGFAGFGPVDRRDYVDVAGALPFPLAGRDGTMRR